jgi:hypothetical protein
MFDTVSLPASELLLGKLISYFRAYHNYLKKGLLLAEQLLTWRRLKNLGRLVRNFFVVIIG